MFRLPCKEYLKGTCTNSFCEKWHPPECFFYKSEKGCRFGDKCSYVHRQVEEQPSKMSQKKGDKSAVALLKRHEHHHRSGSLVVNFFAHQVHDNWVAYFRIWSRPSLHRFCTRAQTEGKPIRCVKFIKAVLRHADVRDQNPSLGKICTGEPHQRNPNAPKFEDRSQEETEWQERCAREAAWKLAKSILKLNEKSKAAFFSPSENRCHQI